MTEVLLVAFVLFGVVGMTGIALALAAKRSETEQERMALRARLVAISRQRDRWYDD
jgi:hypothetical protein